MNSRLDLLIYAHDGRGLGHVGRSSAVGMAFKRMFPEKSVLLVTGCGKTRELAGERLDWLKLPSYATKVVDGVSKGSPGPSGLGDAELGHLRGSMISDIVERFRPRVVLADHTPQGKHRELVPAMEKTVGSDTKWILGLRAVVGEVGKVWSDLAADLFSAYFSGFIWYGDEKVLGEDEIHRLREHFGKTPFKAGYVSRLKELLACPDQNPDSLKTVKNGGVISIPWTLGDSRNIYSSIASAVNNMGDRQWNFYTGGCSKGERQTFLNLFKSETSVKLHSFGPGFIQDLREARVAVIYGGYNSLTDVMAVGIPSVVLLRGMKDGEQERHARLLSTACPYIADVVGADELGPQRLRESLEKCFSVETDVDSGINLDGAANAADYLYSFLKEEEC